MNSRRHVSCDSWNGSCTAAPEQRGWQCNCHPDNVLTNEIMHRVVKKEIGYRLVGPPVWGWPCRRSAGPGHRLAAGGIALAGGRQYAGVSLRAERIRSLARPRSICRAAAEVLVSAITIPDMIRIIEHHGLVPVPVDLDPQRMAPSEEQWRQAITPATKMILVAHLFGGRTEMGPILELARRHNLLVVEDCARRLPASSTRAIRRPTPACSVSARSRTARPWAGRFSASATREVLARMRAAQAAYPLQSRWPYFKRLAKYAMLKGLAARPICALFVHVCRAIGCDYDRMVNAAARGFPGERFLRPNPPSAVVAAAGDARTPPETSRCPAGRSDTSPKAGRWRKACKALSHAPARRSFRTPTGSFPSSSNSRPI